MASVARNLTDRAFRYRANQAIPEHARVCAFCGSTQVEVGHVNGDESDHAPDNLTWTCRPCNVIAANTLRQHGIGRKTHQFNPTKSGGAANVGEWINAVGAITPRVDRGERGLASTMNVDDAVAMIRATPHHKRSQFASELRKHMAARKRANPALFAPGGIFGSRDYAYDIQAAREAATEARRSKPEVKARYRGYTIYRTPDGEYFSSLDPDSWYEGLAQVKRAIDSFKKGRAENPGRFPVGSFVKGVFHEGKYSERLWVKVERTDDRTRTIYGRIDNEPVLLRKVRLGSPVTLAYGSVIARMNPTDRANPGQANRYQEIAQRYFQKLGSKFGEDRVHVRQARRGGESGEYQDGSVFLKTPNPTTPDRLYTFLHEVGHLMLDHNRRDDLSQNAGEVEAERYAMDAMQREGVPLSPHVKKMIAYDMATTIVQDMRDGVPIDQRAKDMADGYLTKGGAYGAKAYQSALARYEKLRSYNNPAKFDRCVKAVKSKGGAYDPYAVCTAAGTRNPAKSKGHLFFKDGYEWYKAGGEVYRASLDSVFENGYRIGRWEFPEWQIAERKKHGVYPFAKSNPELAHSKSLSATSARPGETLPGPFVRISGGTPLRILETSGKGKHQRFLIEADASGKPYYGWVDAADIRRNPREHPNYDASLIRQAETARTSEELNRLYRWALKKDLGDLQRAVQRRAGQLRITLTAPNGKGKNNPKDEADAMFQSFHGKPADETIEIVQDVHEHEHLATLGHLTEAFVDTLTGLRLHLTWEGEDMPFLASTEDGSQLYIKAGKETIDLKKIQMDGPEWVKDRMVIGEFSPPDPCSKCGGEFKYSERRNVWVCSECRHVANDGDRVHNITYLTEKDFDRFEEIAYQHALGEETGVRPLLEWEPRNEQLFVTGGQYRIQKPLFQTSPGIEN